MTRKTNNYKGKKYIYYYCPTGKKHGCQHPVMIKETDLKNCVLESLQAHINNVVSIEKLLDSINEEQINRELIAKYKTQIADNEARMEQAMRFKATLYENFVNGLLDKDEYKTLRDNYDEQVSQAQEAIELLRKKMDNASTNTSDRLKWTQHFKRFASMTELDRRAVIALIQSIKVIDKTELKITFRYQMEYDAAIEKLSRYEIPLWGTV